MNRDRDPRRSHTAPEGWWPPNLQRVERAELEGGRPIRIEDFRPKGISLERCRWEGERLVEATVVEQTDRPGVDHRDVFEWRGSDLVLIERHPRQGERLVVYQRRRLPTEGADGFWYRWQAAEWTSAAEVPELDSYGDEEFRERCDVVGRQVSLDGDHRLTARLLQAVTRRLNRIEWGDLLPVTDDFLIYAWEIHGDSLEDDLAASVPGGEAPSEVGPVESMAP